MSNESIRGQRLGRKHQREVSIHYAAIQHVVFVSKTFNALQVPRSELGISKNDKRHLLIVDADAASA